MECPYATICMWGNAYERGYCAVHTNLVDCDNPDYSEALLLMVAIKDFYNKRGGDENC